MHLATNAEMKLANALPDAILILNRDYRLQVWNEAAQRFFKLNTTSVSKTLLEIIPDEAVPTWLKQMSKKSLVLPAPQKPNLKLSLLLRPYHTEQFILIAQDVTRTYRLEKIRQDFVANVSHELRTPLTVIHGYLEALLENDSASSSKEWRSILQQMQSQSQRMEVLVEDLLLLSRLEGDTSELEDKQEVNVPTLLQRVYHDVKRLSSSKQQELLLKVDQDLNLIGQPNELYSALANLVTNAVRYTPAMGRITVTWEAYNNSARIVVQDTGIGIAAKHIPRLTQRFYRVDKARSRGDGGTGLGLAIVKHVLIRHEAELKIQSKEDKGSTFSCIFPPSRVITKSY